jgi:hypothetical protein
MIELVTHAWAGTLDQYAILLRLQLSSLVLNPAPCDVVASVCYSSDDPATMEVLADFEDCDAFELKRWPLEHGKLFRRCIGRNLAALDSKADIVWFTDVDHCFGNGCLAALHEVFGQMTAMHPTRVLISYDPEGDHWARGDDIIDATRGHRGVVDFEKTTFAPRREGHAWGGLQIVSGDLAREIGYLNWDKAWHVPVQGNRFLSCRGDVPFRRRVHKHGTGWTRYKLPSIYRVRHSKMGRNRRQS